MYITNFRQLNLQLLTGMYKAYPDKKKFFNSYFVRLAGTAKLKEQINRLSTVRLIIIYYISTTYSCYHIGSVASFHGAMVPPQDLSVH